MALNREQGFTLIELIISLSILSLLVGVLFAGIHTGNNTWNAIERKGDRLDVLRLVWHYLDDRIRDIHPAYRNDQERGRVLLFTGENNGLEFVSSSSYQNGYGGFYLIRIELVNSADSGEDLVVRQWLYQPGILEGGETVPEWEQFSGEKGNPLDLKRLPNANYSESILVEGIQDLSVAYFGREDDTSEEKSWQDNWSEKHLLPELVRITIKDSQGDWPTLHFAINNAMSLL